MKRSLIYFSCLMVLFFMGDCKPPTDAGSGEIILLPAEFHHLKMYTEPGLLADQILMKARWECMDRLNNEMDSVPVCRKEAEAIAMTSVLYHSLWSEHESIKNMINSLPLTKPSSGGGGLSGCTKSAVGAPQAAPSGGPILDPGHNCDATCFTHSTLQMNSTENGMYALDVLLSPVPDGVSISASLFAEENSNQHVATCMDNSCLQPVTIGDRDFLRLTLVGNMDYGDYLLHVTHTFSNNAQRSTDFRVTLTR